MINHDHKCIFIHIPKTGGTSIAKALDITRNHKLGKELKKEYNSYWNDYTTFSVVRNPWDRMVSLYFYYKKNNEIINLHIKNDIPSTFSNFIHEFNEKRRRWYTTFYQHQANWVYDDEENLLVDYVCRFENLNKDVGEIFNKIGINKTLSHERKSVHEHYKTYYNEETIEIVRNLFEKDIILFDYEY